MPILAYQALCHLAPASLSTLSHPSLLWARSPPGPIQGSSCPFPLYPFWLRSNATSAEKCALITPSKVA